MFSIYVLQNVLENKKSENFREKVWKINFEIYVTILNQETLQKSKIYVSLSFLCFVNVVLDA